MKEDWTSELRINGIRVFLGGFLATALLVAFGALPIYALGEDWITWLQELARAVPLLTIEDSVLDVLPSLALGLCAVWLYAAILPHYGPGPATALVAGFAIWLIIAVAHSSLFLAGLIPIVPTLIALGIYLPILLISTVAGSWLYKEGEEAVEPAKLPVAAPARKPVPARTAAPEETRSMAKKVSPAETMPTETALSLAIPRGSDPFVIGPSPRKKL